MGTYNISGGNFKNSAIGDNATVNNSDVSDFDKAKTLINNSLLDSPTIAALCDLLSQAKKATERNDELQKTEVKNKFWKNFGEKAKAVLSILAECATVLDFFGIKSQISL